MEYHIYLIAYFSAFLFSSVLHLKSNFSVVYHRLLEDLFQLEVPTESWADCQDCHLCFRGTNLRDETKCCDYTPMLPNYVVGSILLDESDDYKVGKKRISHTISNRLGVTPYGVYSSFQYQQLFSYIRKPNSTATKEDVLSLKCPYLDHGNCTIYRYRTDLCGFHHCSSVALSTGKNFWKKAYAFSSSLDRALSIYIAEKLGFSLSSYPTKLKRLSTEIEREDGTLDEEKYQQMWTGWEGSKVDYYLACAKVFHTADVKQLRLILGEELEQKENELYHLSDNFHANKVPDFLHFNATRCNEYLKKSGNQLFTTKEHLILQHFDGKTETAIIIKKAKRSFTRITPLLEKALSLNILKAV